MAKIFICISIFLCTHLADAFIQSDILSVLAFYGNRTLSNTVSNISNTIFYCLSYKNSFMK